MLKPLDEPRPTVGSSNVVRLMGVPLDAFTPSGLVTHLVAASRAGRGGYVMTPNLDNLRLLSQDPEMFNAALRADIRVPDGMPLIWASRIQGTPLPARVPGSDLIFSLSHAAARADRTVFLVGGNPGTAERAAAILHDVTGGLRVVGTHCPPFGFEHDAHELADVVRRLRETQPDFVYIGMPVPKAVPLVEAAREALPGSWFLGLGISFSFVCGDVQRAPAWIQRCGLEWVHRMLQEPRRLGRRYLLEGLPFAARLLAAAVLHRFPARAV